MTEYEVRQRFIAFPQQYVGCKRIKGEHKQFCDTYNKFIAENTTKIAGYPRTSKMSYDYAWCSCFASAMAIEAGYAMTIIPIEMSCTKAIRMWAAMGRWVEDDNYTPDVGDFIYIDHAGTTNSDSKGVEVTDHVGIVEFVENGYIHTIEGNISIGGFSCVGRKKRKVGAADIAGFGIPDFASLANGQPQYEVISTTATATSAVATVEPATAKVELRILRRGYKGSAVTTLQVLLGHYGLYNTEKIDGSFGPLTQTAVIAFQKTKNLTPDGVCGPATWKALVG